MTPVKAELLSAGGNIAIVKLPGRQFPGLLVQGDTFSTLRETVLDIQAALAEGDLAAARPETESVRQTVDQWLKLYIEALDHEGIRLPFNRPDGM